MCYIYIYVYIYKSGYIYIYKVAKDPMSQELPLADSKMQSSVSLIYSTQPFQDKAAQTEESNYNRIKPNFSISFSKSLLH